MTSELRRPQKGDNPFFTKPKEYNDKTCVNIEWFKSFNIDPKIADAFKESGDIIINELEKGKYRGHPDKYFFPIAYLYRHAFELKLKHLIKMGIDLKLLIEKDGTTKALTDHKLYPLWNYAKEAILKLWPNDMESDLQVVERIIQQFHTLDSSGQNFRYVKDIKGKSTLDEIPDSIELLTLKDDIEGSYNFLEGCQCGFEAEEEAREEEARENDNNMY